MTHSPARRATRSRPATREEKPQASRIAFLGFARVSTDAGETVFVQSLCWPAVPTAWIDLTQTFHSLSTGRGTPSPNLPSVDRPLSWARTCAPQLAAPFSGTAAAEESSIAALLARTSMRVAIAAFDSRDGGMASGVPQQALSPCLSVYDQSVRPPMRPPCTLLVSRSQSSAIDKQCLEELARCRVLMPNAPWLGDLQLQFWKDAPEPLPLELAQVVAAAVARQMLSENTNDPLFEALLAKLAHNPFQRRRSAQKRR